MRQDRVDVTRSGERTKIHRDRGKTNWLLLYNVLFLTALGMLFIYKLTSVEKDIDNRWYYVIMQGTFGLCGLLCALIISKLDYRRINEICSCLLGFAIVLVILLQIPRFNAGQVLALGEMTISVPLVLMPALCLMLAKILCEHVRAYNVEYEVPEDKFATLVKCSKWWVCLTDAIRWHRRMGFHERLFRIWEKWGSGCFTPYNSPVGVRRCLLLKFRRAASLVGAT